MIYKLNNDLLSLTSIFLILLDFSNLEKSIKINNIVFGRYIKKYNVTIGQASMFGNLNIVKYIYTNNLYDVITIIDIATACVYGNLDIVKYLYKKLKHLPYNDSIDYNWLFMLICERDYIDIIVFFCDVIKISSLTISDGLYYAKNKNVIEYLSKKL